MSTKRQIRAKDVVADIRSGLTNAQLMQKYQLSARSLEGILDKLLKAQALLEMELAGREVTSADESETSGSTLREAARSYVMFKLPVYDLDNMTVEGHVHDISETGLMTIGIAANAGDTKSLLVQADEFADVYPFSFDAVCRRVEEGGDADERAAAFEITSISEVGRGELRKLCRLLGLS